MRWMPAMVIVLATATVAFAEAEAPSAVRSILDASAHPNLRRKDFARLRDSLRTVYEARAFAPLWIENGRPTRSAHSVLQGLVGAERVGLRPADYDVESLHALAATLREEVASGPDTIARFDTGLTIAAMRYVEDAHSGRVDPRKVGFGLEVPPKVLDLAAAIRDLARSQESEPLAKFNPPFPIFARLVAKLAHFRDLAARTDVPVIEEVKKIQPGETHEAIPEIRRLLRLLGDIPNKHAVPANPKLYDDALAQAVKHFQWRHGLDADGIIGRATVRVMRVPLGARVTQIVLALERLRWLPYDFAERFVVVNVPEFRLRGFTRGAERPVITMEVVVGSAAERTETPIMHAEMKYLIFRPYWHVPRSIVRNEILPKMEKDPGYLARNHMEVINGDRIRQRPGPNNALGLVKFIMPNRYNVYLHDTPKKALFSRSRRDFSHGCIRVADPVGLAEFVLQGQGGWTREQIVQAMNHGSSNTRVDLEQPVPVYVFYTTVVVEEAGTTHFFEDIYGHDSRLEKELRSRRM